MKITDVDPSFMAWLRAEKYVNGLGPRSWVINGQRVVLPAWTHVPTPGLSPAWDFHDLGCLIGGNDEKRFILEGDVIQLIHDEAKRAWWLRRIAIENIGIPAAKWGLDRYGKTRFRYTQSGIPRTQQELMINLKWPQASEWFASDGSGK